MKDKLLEFLAANDAENIALKTPVFWNLKPSDSIKRGPHQWRVKLWESALSSDENTSFDDDARPSAAEMYELWRSTRLEKMVFTDQSQLLQEMAIKLIANPILIHSIPPADCSLFSPRTVSW